MFKVDLLHTQVKLVQHTYSCLYGTFLCNNAREREARNIYKRTCSVWSLLRTGNKHFQNFLYIPSHDMVHVPLSAVTDAEGSPSERGGGVSGDEVCLLC